jgi:NTP pyrophosphatase (non-canonical NTP hydrolase)
MKALIDDVSAFHTACDIPINTTPAIVTERVELRRNILAEEWRETDEAMARGDLIEVADGLADIIYVAVGTALEFGIPLDRVWAEVQRTNMAKVDPVTGKVRQREDGKVLKPDGWTPPDIATALRGQP